MRRLWTRRISTALENYAQAYYELRQRKGVTIRMPRRGAGAKRVPAMMVKMGDADASSRAEL